MIIKPINNRVLIKKLIQEKNLISGIIIPENISEKPDRGIIIAFDDKNKTLKKEIKIGDHVLFNKYSGQIVNLNNEELLIIKEDDILAIIN